MRALIGRWGNSLAVRIPVSYVKALGLKEGMKLDAALPSDGVLLRPCPREYRLEELIDGITPENLHGETDWGPSVGRES